MTVWLHDQKARSKAQRAQRARPAPGAARMVSKGLKVSEHDVQRQILDFLEIKRIFHRRRNIGAIKAEYGGKKRFVQFSTRGEADIWGILPPKGMGVPGCHFELEVKTPGWKPPKFHFTRNGKVNKAYVHYQEQLMFLQAINRTNCLGAFVQSLDEARRVLGI